MSTNAPERLPTAIDTQVAFFVQVAVPLPLRNFFTYLPSEKTSQSQYKSGTRVLIPFRNRKVIGIILSTQSRCTVPVEKLKAVISVLDDKPVITPDILALCQWASRYYHYSLGEVFMQALPRGVRQGKPLPSNTETYWQLHESLSEVQIKQLKRSPKQLVVAHMLNNSPSLELEETQLLNQGISRAVIKGLADKHIIHKKEKMLAATCFSTHGAEGGETALPLNAEQENALNNVLSHLNHYQPFLLDGITGSGKTEVYLQAIAAVLKAGRQTLVLIPEIGLSPQTVGRFKRRFHTPVINLHSGLSDGERLCGWYQALTENAGIVISTRSGIFTPLPKLGLIIVDEEHDSSYKQQDTFRYNARDLAIYRAKQAACPVILGSATPSLESFYNAAGGRFQHLTLRVRAGQARPPALNILDLRQQPLESGIPADSLAHMSAQLNLGNQVMVFINRRGYAPSVICHDCGTVIDCPHCDAHMTIHRQPPHMHCHHCDYQIVIPHCCHQCHSTNIHPVGQGTERLEQALSERFPHTPVIRIDRDSTRTKNALSHMLETINTGVPCILLGTQMLAKGHHFANVTLVVILNADGSLLGADFRGIERTGQLIMQVAGRAGRSHKPGQVIIQTYNPNHDALRLLTQNHYSLFLASLLEQRRQLELPPFSFMAVIRAESGLSQACEHLLQAARQAITRQAIKGTASDRLKVLGPLPAPMEKRQSRFRWQLILQASQRASLHTTLSRLIAYLDNQKLPRHLRWSVDIDPQDMT